MTKRRGHLIGASVTLVTESAIIPAGTIQPFGGGTVPTGWLLCDGSTVDRTTYATLFGKIGTIHGQGNGTTTFHLPDLRGRFVRGADNMGTGAAGRDPNAGARTAANTGGATGATVGSVQGTGLPNLDGNIGGLENGSTPPSGVFASLGTENGGGGTGTDFRVNFNAARYSSLYQSVTESRPINANTLYIIKT